MKRVLVFLICLSLVGCYLLSNKCEYENNEIGEDLLNSKKGLLFNYCSCLSRALNQEENAVKDFVLLDYQNGLSFEHGQQVVFLIDSIGVNEFISNLDGFTEKELLTVYFTIKVGLDYNENFKEVSEVYPALFNFFCERIGDNKKQYFRCDSENN